MTVTVPTTRQVAPRPVRRRDGEIEGLADRLAHLVLPSPCLGCGAPLGARQPALALCRACRGELAPPPRPACATCGARLTAAAPPPGFLCARCRRSPPAFERLLAAWRYAPPLDEAIRAFKFSRRRRIGRGLAAGLAAAVERDLGARPQVVVPVPLHWRRRLARGYDQAERIARPLARRLGLPFGRPLRRRHATMPQTALGRSARRANPRHAFALRRRYLGRSARLRGRRVLLVDDVVTTGATLDAAAHCLLSAGADTVIAAAAALAPEPENPDAIEPHRHRYRRIR